LSTSSIGRLKKTWNALEDSERKIYEEYEQLMSPGSSFGRYREHLRQVNPPCIPFLAVYLSDLTFIDEGNPNFFPSTGEGLAVINCDKCELVYEVISKVQLYQAEYYELKKLEPLATLLEELPRFNEDTIYKFSVEYAEERATSS